MKKLLMAFVALAFVLALAAPAFSEDPAQETAKPQLKTEIVRLKYYTYVRMQSLIYTFLGGKTQISQGPDEKILVIRDTQENIDKVLQAIRQVDVKPADLAITVQLVLGSQGEEKGQEAMPNDPVIRELRNLLQYKSYSLLDTSLIRTMDNADSEVRLGGQAEFQFNIRPKVIKDEKSSLIQMEVRLRQFRLAGMPPNATSAKPEYIVTELIGTTLNAKPGEKTVVGVSKLDGGDKGLILIISGKIVD